MFRAAAMLPALLAATALAQNAERYPDLPVGIKNGVAGLIGQTIYVGLGSAGQQFYALDLSRPQPQWTEIAPFPDAARDQAVAAVVNGKMYVFGGMGKTSPEATTAVFNQVHAYDPATNSWAALPTRAPREVAGGAAVVQEGQILMFGGVNKNIFDGYFKDLAAAGSDKARSDAVARAYFDQRPQDYFFGQEVQAYNPQRNTWQSLGTVPFGGRAGAALVNQQGTLTEVGGEVKPGLRSPLTFRGVMRDSGLRWSRLGALPRPQGSEVQDGVAGAFAGVSGGAVLVAGGTNFPGSNARFEAGTLYAHEGLTKTWYSDVYALLGNRWTRVGQLPQAQAYGASVQNGNEVVMIGGELTGGTASRQVFSLEWQDGHVVLHQ